MKPIVMALALIFCTSAAAAQTPVTVAPDQQALLKSDDPELERNKRLVYDFWREVFIAGRTERAEFFMREDYIQHNPAVADGRAAFLRFFGNRPPRDVPETIPGLVTIMAEGDLVVLAFRRELPDPRTPGQTYTTTWFDMFRIIDGQIGEHWDYGTIQAPGAGRGGG